MMIAFAMFAADSQGSHERRAFRSGLFRSTSRPIWLVIKRCLNFGAVIVAIIARWILLAKIPLTAAIMRISFDAHGDSR